VTGVSLTDQLTQVPMLEGIVDEVVSGIYQAFSLAIADTFWVGLVATLAALAVIAVGLRDLPIKSLRRGMSVEEIATGEEDETNEAETAPSPPAIA
jgi:hypothetical protein